MHFKATLFNMASSFLDKRGPLFCMSLMASCGHEHLYYIDQHRQTHRILITQSEPTDLISTLEKLYCRKIQHKKQNRFLCSVNKVKKCRAVFIGIKLKHTYTDIGDNLFMSKIHFQRSR